MQFMEKLDLMVNRQEELKSKLIDETKKMNMEIEEAQLAIKEKYNKSFQEIMVKIDTNTKDMRE